MQSRDASFFVSLFFTRLSDQMLLFLVPLVVFQTTGSASLAGLAFFIETLPRYLLFSVCGILCDRYSPARLLSISQRCRLAACIVGVIAHEAFGGIGWLVALSAVCGILSTQGFLAREVMLPQIFRHQRFEKVLSYSQLGDQLGMVSGPLLAAFLLGFWPWQGVVAATALLFLAADLSLTWWLRRSNVQLAEGETGYINWHTPLITALRNVWQLPGLLRATVLAASLNLVYGVTLATSAAMATGYFGGSEQDYAWLQAAGAIASIAILAVLAHVIMPLRAMGVISYILIFLGGILTALGHSFAMYATGFILVMGFDKMFSTYVRSLRQKIIPQRDFGKTTGVIITLNNLSQPLAGLLVSLFSGAGHLGMVIGSLVLVMGVSGALVAALPPPKLT